MKPKVKVRTKPVEWESQYRKSPLWEQKPHAYSILASRHLPVGKVLDIGCGEGHDCLYFASRKYSVTGLDISKTAITWLRKEAQKNGFKIKTVLGDIRSYAVSEKYDIIVSYGTLQFLGARHAAFMSELKQHTSPGGIHAFYIFDNKGDFYNIAKNEFWFPSLQDLKRLYADWTILKLQKKKVALLIRGDKGEQLYNLMFKILVRNKN